MKKYKKVAINLAFLAMILSAGVTSGQFLTFNQDLNLDTEINLTNKESENYSQEKQEKILNTFENNNYQTWKKIIGQNNKINNVVNELTFQRFVRARSAARNGQYTKALKITEEIKKELAPSGILNLFPVRQI